LFPVLGRGFRVSKLNLIINLKVVPYFQRKISKIRLGSGKKMCPDGEAILRTNFPELDFAETIDRELELIISSLWN
jgi:hypothetical protein